MHALLAALAFLTRLPVPAGSLDGTTVGRSLLWYPAVGILLGAVAAFTADAAAATATPVLGAALGVAVLVVLSGALHLDGLADTADAWVGGLGDRERTLAIMKDSYAGPIGVAAVVVVLMLEVAAVAALVQAGRPLLVVVAVMLGRAAAPALFLATPYVRSGGLGEALAQHRPGGPVYAVLLVTAALAVLTGRAGLATLVASIVIVVGLRSAFLRRLGGITGDTVGATMTLTQALCLVAAALAA